MRTNVKRPKTPAPRTHEGAIAKRLTPAQELRRSIMACMLFEGTFYESGQDHATRVRELCKQVSFTELATLAIEAREKMKLRHAPLLLVREALRVHKGRQVGDLIARVIQRPDECSELLALYWADNKNAPLTAQLKQGLARALKKFNAYSLAKYAGSAEITIRDVMFLTRPRAKDLEQEITFTKLANKKLESPDTWEVALSAGANKRETFERLLREEKLGALAVLRNLRNMVESGVPRDLIACYLANMNIERVLPFRFISAARHAPSLEPAIEYAMLRALQYVEKLPGKTALLIDHSGSMNGTPVSQKSEIDRFEAACALAILVREVCEHVRVFAFSYNTVEVPARRGFALRDAIRTCMSFSGTDLRQAVDYVYAAMPECERLIVITDEQSQSKPTHPRGRGYVINVGTYQNGITYGDWVGIDGWSEAVLSYIQMLEGDEREE